MNTTQLSNIKNPSTTNVTDFFDETYLKIYAELLNLELNSQLSFLKENYLDKDGSQHVLDLCCGNGRHLIPLSQEGYQVDGVDINKNYIKSIMDTLDKSKSNSHLYASDVQEFKQTNYQYDLIYSLESSIGYLPDEQTLKILTVINSLLSDSGKFVLHLINKKYLTDNLVRRMWFKTSKNDFLLEDRTFNAKENNITLSQIRIIKNIPKEYSVNLKLYSLDEIKLLLGIAGLKIVNVTGNFESQSFEDSSPYMIIEAEKMKGGD